MFTVTQEDIDSTIQHLRSSKITEEEFDIYWRKLAQHRFYQMKKSKSTSDILKLWPEYLKTPDFQLVRYAKSLKIHSLKIHKQYLV